VEFVKLHWIEFVNLRTGLEIERIYFNEDITLLVGLSGVGKSQILNAIEYSLRLAVDKNTRLKPYKVKLAFSVKNEMYEWEYCIEPVMYDEIVDSNEIKYAFAYERLSRDDTTLILRDGEHIEINGYEKVPVPKKDESLLVQYAEDDLFKSIISNLVKMYPIEIEMDVRGIFDKEGFNELKKRIEEMMKKKPQRKVTSFSHLSVPIKLYIIKKYYKELYANIFAMIKELFMEIDDLDIVEDDNTEAYMVAIKVYGKVLRQNEISNGMLKTIYYVVELMTMSKDSLALIDEFENGLGMNCIQVLADILLNERNDLQFIITSHHPKIIGQIEKDKWKIIDRKANVVKNSAANEYGIGNSQHDAYFNLINKWEFEGKI
jgi:predicted ATPase